MDKGKRKKSVVNKTHNRKKDLHGTRNYEGIYLHDSMENVFPEGEQQEIFDFGKWFREMRNFL